MIVINIDLQVTIRALLLQSKRGGSAGSLVLQGMQNLLLILFALEMKRASVSPMMDRLLDLMELKNPVTCTMVDYLELNQTADSDYFYFIFLLNF